MHDIIQVSGNALTRFWHCFGNERNMAPLPLVASLLDESRTNVLPVNTHRLNGSRDRRQLEHGFAGVTYDDLCDVLDVSRYVVMLNINLRNTADAAVSTAKLAFEMTGETVLKLEVLRSDLRRSDDAAVLEAARRLLKWDPSLVVLPLISCDLDVAKEAIQVGCPLLRVMGSPIASASGIADKDTFSEICELPVPTVLDGGVGSVEDIAQAASLGAAGALVNSILFMDGRSPEAVMRDYAAAAAVAFRAT